MSPGPGIRRKDISLRVGAITLDQRHRAKNSEILGPEADPHPSRFPVAGDDDFLVFRFVQKP